MKQRTFLEEIADSIRGLWIMEEMATVFPAEEGGRQLHPEAQGTLLYDNGRVHAAIYRNDDKSPTGKLQFQYAAEAILASGNHIVHRIFDAHKPEGPAPRMHKDEERQFRLEDDRLYITGRSVQHENATIEIKWRRVKNYAELNNQPAPNLNR